LKFDVYSFGAIAYELLTGAKLFRIMYGLHYDLMDRHILEKVKE